MEKIYTALGLMSGTSMDGVDASIIQSNGEEQYDELFSRYFKYNSDIYQNLLNLRDKITKNRKPNYNNALLESLSKEFKDIEKKITLFHADVVSKILKEVGLSVDLIGFHGQTIFHNPSENNPQENKSIQLGDGKLLSKLTNKTVIYNFRENDLKHGGGGAPLTPIFHLLLAKKKLRQNELPVLILNIGGIANVTGINHYDNSKNDQLFALDIGPGNCLIDKWIRKKSKKNYDENGTIAKSGKINKVILDKALSNWVSYLDGAFDRNLISHDIGDYDYSFANKLSLEDGAATITEYSSEIYSHFIKKLLVDVNPNAVIVCGGGRKNKFLMESFENKIDCPLIKIDDFNIDGDFIESQAFGYLSIRSYLKLPISFPKTTGCDKPCTGGVIVKNY
jgi:anhydro-N-acetylmuramic acid kinase